MYVCDLLELSQLVRIVRLVTMLDAEEMCTQRNMNVGISAALVICVLIIVTVVRWIQIRRASTISSVKVYSCY